MEIKILQIILVFFAACIIGMDSILDEFQFHRPIIACSLIGLILGNIEIGIIIGSSLEIISLSWVNIGGTIAPDTALPSIIATILVIATKQNIGTGILLSIPLSIIGQILSIVTRTFCIFFQHEANKAANEGNLLKLDKLHISALIIHAMRVAIPATLALIASGTDVVNRVLNNIPEYITNGFNISGNIMSIVGFAIILNMIKTDYLMPFFYLGFIITAFSNINLVGLGIIGIILAVIYIQLKSNNLDNNIEDNILDDELD